MTLTIMDCAVKWHNKKLVVSALVRKDLCPIIFYTLLRMSAFSRIIQLPLLFWTVFLLSLSFMLRTKAMQNLGVADSSMEAWPLVKFESCSFVLQVFVFGGWWILHNKNKHLKLWKEQGGFPRRNLLSQ